MLNVIYYIKYLFGRPLDALNAEIHEYQLTNWLANLQTYQICKWNSLNVVLIAEQMN